MSAYPAANRTWSKRYCVTSACGRALCGRCPRYVAHRRPLGIARTRSPMSCSWCSIQSSYDRLTRPLVSSCWISFAFAEGPGRSCAQTVVTTAGFFVTFGPNGPSTGHGRSSARIARVHSYPTGASTQEMGCRPPFGGEPLVAFPPKTSNLTPVPRV